MALCFPARADIYRTVDCSDRRIALTFDDGPHPRLTPRILKILEQYNVRATFFMIGKHVGYYPETAQMVVDAGHEIGNHSFSHVRLCGLGEQRVQKELDDCSKTILETCKTTPRVFRPPEGAVDKCVLTIADRNDYQVILWSIDTRDWESKNANAIITRVLASVKPGDIILMHDYIGQNSKTPEALERLLPKLLARGFKPVTVSELLRIGSG